MASKNTETKELVKNYLFFILKFLVVFLFLSWFFNLKFINDLFINFFVLVIKGFLFIIGKGTTSIVDNQLFVNGIPMIVLKECTGTAMYSLFLAFAFAYKFSKKNLKYVGLGLLMLIGLNILRLFTIIVSTYFGKSVFNFVHDFLWPSTFFIFTLIVVLYYIKRCSK